MPKIFASMAFLKWQATSGEQGPISLKLFGRLDARMSCGFGAKLSLSLLGKWTGSKGPCRVPKGRRSAGDCRSPEAPCPFRDKGVSRSQERVMFHIFSHMSVCTDAALDWGLWLKMQNKPFAEARPLRPFVGRAAFWGCFGRVGLHRPSLRLPSSRFPLSLVVFPLGFCFFGPLRSGNFGA